MKAEAKGKAEAEAKDDKIRPFEIASNVTCNQ
jgi:hypothetical protein